MRSRFTSFAESEFSDAAAFYENASSGIGGDFIKAVLATISKLEKHPTLGRIRRKNFRSFPIQRFPYDINYEIIADEIVIHAISHQSRKPEYWIDRVAE